MHVFLHKLPALMAEYGILKLMPVNAHPEHILMPLNAILFPPATMEKCTTLSIIYATVLMALSREDIVVWILIALMGNTGTVGNVRSLIVLHLPTSILIDVFTEEIIIAHSAMYLMGLIACSTPQPAQQAPNGFRKAVNQIVNVGKEIIWMAQDNAEYSHKYVFHQPLGMVRDALDQTMPAHLELILKEISVCLTFPARMVIYGILPT